MRVATWNLERPKPQSWKRTPRQQARMREVAADIWVLTETRKGISPADGYHGLHTPPHPARRPDPDERWVGLWSRWPMTPTEVPPDPRGSVSAVVHTPSGDVVVYGTVIAWGNEPGDDGTARKWEVHYREIERQGEEWRQLRERYPDAPMIVAGDFNMALDRSGWYGTARGVGMLTRALDDADLRCLTSEDVVAAGKLPDRHLVDHIAVSRDWQLESSPLHCWPTVDRDGVELSDHPTIAVDLPGLVASHDQRSTVHVCGPELRPVAIPNVAANREADGVPTDTGWPRDTSGGGHPFTAAEVAAIASLCSDLQADLVTAVARATRDRQPLCWRGALEATGATSPQLRSNLGRVTKRTREVISDREATLIAVAENTAASHASGHRYWLWMPVGLADLWLGANGHG